ncbi:MAG: nitrogenase component 1 [Firmicutes bacterium]|nr:nitrogenase component 1 [Bacillota bacterium]
MSDYLTNITPDSFSGVIFALEGVSRSVLLLNGPTGCKFYHAAISDTQAIRRPAFDPPIYPEQWFFRQPRVPCTYLDSSDYIYGARDKLTEALNFLRANVSFDLLCIVNSPGAALIGDDLRGIAAGAITDKPVIVVETPGFSSDICTGYETGVNALLRQLPLEPSGPIAPRTVNMLGLSIYHRNYLGDIRELKRLLALGGISVNCVLGADCDLQSIRRLPQAALNIVIHPEYGLKTARYLQERFGTTYYVCAGPPIGFAATETFIHDLCGQLAVDDAACRTDCGRARARAYPFISRVNALTGLPKGVPFAVEGTYSELYAYLSFLVRYLGMIPDCVSVQNPGSDCFRDRLTALCAEFGALESLERDMMQTNAELVFGSGGTIAGLKLRQHQFTGIETCLPTLGYIDVIPKTHLGVRGALTLVEQVLNGILY